jgi:hypothetical protein
MIENMSKAEARRTTDYGGKERSSDFTNEDSTDVAEVNKYQYISSNEGE